MAKNTKKQLHRAAILQDLELGEATDDVAEKFGLSQNAVRAVRRRARNKAESSLKPLYDLAEQHGISESVATNLIGITFKHGGKITLMSVARRQNPTSQRARLATLLLKSSDPKIKKALAWKKLRT